MLRLRRGKLTPSRAWTTSRAACLCWFAICVSSYASPSTPVTSDTFFTNSKSLVGLTSSIILLVSLALVVRYRMVALRSELQRSKELANHYEHERDLAQRELVRRLEEERELAKQKLQFDAQLTEYEKYASLAQLALGAAHEINNPLLGIMSHLELEWRQSSGEHRLEVEQCVESTKRISMAVRGLLDYARPGPLVLGKVSLFKLVSETLKFVEHQPMFRNLTLTNRVPLDLPPITADVNQLSQILMNLLLNAAQATTAGGSINIAANPVPSTDAIELTVMDSGGGIPSDILPHVFEPFFTTKRGKGTGLGLSITQSYVRSHGGDIQVQSTVGIGTTVKVTLPAHPLGKPIAEYQEVIA